MPFARLTIANLDLDPGVQRRLANAITTRLVSDLEKEAEVAVCHINLVSADCWYIAGQPLAGDVGAHLEVSITAGTNSPDEKAAFLQNAYAELESQLGPVAPAVYVALYELDARSYGYNGVSQYQRKLDNPLERD